MKLYTTDATILIEPDKFTLISPLQMKIMPANTPSARNLKSAWAPSGFDASTREPNKSIYHVKTFCETCLDREYSVMDGIAHSCKTASLSTYKEKTQSEEVRRPNAVLREICCRLPHGRQDLFGLRTRAYQILNHLLQHIYNKLKY